MDIPALPFCNMVLRAKKPLSTAYPKQLKTSGDHLKKKRLDLKMLQKEVATKLNITVFTYRNWEKNWRNPSIINIPKIIEFLDYIPWDISCKNLGEKIKTYRKLSDLTQKDLARQICVDPCTVGHMERGEHKPRKKLLKELSTFFFSVNLDNKRLYSIFNQLNQNINKYIQVIIIQRTTSPDVFIFIAYEVQHTIKSLGYSLINNGTVFGGHAR